MLLSKEEVVVVVALHAPEKIFEEAQVVRVEDLFEAPVFDLVSCLILIFSVQ